ncbi:MAG: hypothetical protein KF789_05625 [Bdellovibrionaceae bacterium]|nr:hypothetical protein [Pseudobdellovibrionaceae bacterium]
MAIERLLFVAAGILLIWAMAGRGLSSKEAVVKEAPQAVESTDLKKVEQQVTTDFCVAHAERVATFYEGIKHFGTLSPHMPPEYRECIEDKLKRKAALKEFERQMADVEKRRKEKFREEKKQAIKDRNLINSVRSEK